MKNKDSKFATEQEVFWAENFGDEYINRNRGDDVLASKIAFFSRAFSTTEGIGTIIEMGANIGLNLIAIKKLFPNLSATAVEINKNAVNKLSSLPYIEAHHASIQQFSSTKTFDLVLCCGILIHINPNQLEEIYQKLFALSKRYILIAEYYNPTPVSIPYRGHTDRLFKRDFAGEILDRFPSLMLRDYGFVYHRDNNHPMDDITWFLIEKPSSPE